MFVGLGGALVLGAALSAAAGSAARLGSESGGASNSAGGFEVGVGPSVVVVDEGMVKPMTTATMKDDSCSFAFS